MEDTKALTGEAVPRKVSVGDEIISGCINLTNILKIRTTKEYGESTVARILDLLKNAAARSKGRKLYHQVCTILYARLLSVWQHLLV